MASETRFSATMILAGAATAWGWQVVLAVLAASTPIVMLAVGEEPPIGVVVVCGAAAIVLGVQAARVRTMGAHQIRLERRDGGDVLVVEGPSVSLEARAPLSVRAHLGEIAIDSGRGTIRMPMHVLVIEKDGAPILVLEEAVAATASHDGWPPGAAHELDPGTAPVMRKGFVPAKLEQLRDALRRA